MTAIERRGVGQHLYIGMQEPTWRDVFDYIVAAWQRGDWPYATYVAAGLFIVLVRVLVSWGWARHQQHQRLSIVRCIFNRWVDSLGQPFWTLSTASQLDAIERLRTALVGDTAIVIGLLIALRVHLESLTLDERVLQAVDRLSKEWEDKTASARRRRYRRLRGLDPASIELLERRPES